MKDGEESASTDLAKPTQGTPVQQPFSIAGVDVPAAVLAMFKERPIAAGEKVEEYDAALAAFCSALRPANIFEWAWAKDLTDAHWEARRARRIRNQLLLWMQSDSRSAATVEAIIGSVKEETGGRKGNPARRDASEEVIALLQGPAAKLAEFMSKHHIEPNFELADSKAYLEALTSLEKVDRMIAWADSCRDRILREIDRHRHSAVRRRLVEVQTLLLQAELKELAPPTETSGVDDVATAH
jgi:hypothetical protein